jgi:hypothetical protein
MEEKLIITAQVCTGINWSSVGQSGGLTSNTGEFLDQQNCYLLLTKSSAPCTECVN